MLKISEKRNKLIKIFLSSLLVLTIMFYALAVPPLRASAVTQTYDDYDYSSSHHGHHGGGQHRYNGTIVNDVPFHRIQMALSPFVILLCDLPPFSSFDLLGDDFYYNLYNSLSDSSVSFIIQLANQVSDSYCIFANLEINAVSTLIDEIRSFLISKSSESTDVYLSLDHSFSKLGFTADSHFSFTVPTDQSSYDSLYKVDFGKSIFTFGGVNNSYITNNFPEIVSSYPNGKSLFCSLKSLDSELTYVFYVTSPSTSNCLVKAGTYYSAYPGSSSTFNSNFVLNSSNIDSNNILYFSFANNSKKIFAKAQPLNYYSGFYYNNTYYYLDSVSGGVALINVLDDSYLFGLTWGSRLTFWDWFYSSCGLELPLSYNSSYSVPDYSPSVLDFPYNDNEFPNRKQTILNNSDDGQTVNIVVPGNWQHVDEMISYPSTVLDVTKASNIMPIYPSSLPRIKQVPKLWTTKFPFCIPFDIYNLFATWEAPSECPTFSFVVFPADFFGLGNDELTIDFSFYQYSDFVQILRYCILFGFDFFLLVLSYKVLHH